MRFGLANTVSADDAPALPALPWTVVLTSPPRVNTPLPPMATSLANLPLQLLLAERVMEALGRLINQSVYKNEIANEITADTSFDVEAALTSLVRREDLHRAFPTDFGSWRLDRLPGLTPREALCRVQGLELRPAPSAPSAPQQA